MGDSAGVFVRVPVHSVTRDGSRSALLSRCHLMSEIQTSGLRLFAVTERLEKLFQLTEVISGMPLLSPKITPALVGCRGLFLGSQLGLLKMQMAVTKSKAVSRGQPVHAVLPNPSSLQPKRCL